MRPPVFVCGLGVLSPIGRDLSSCLESLKTERSGIGQMLWLRSRYRGILPVGEVKASNEELAQWARSHPSMSRTALLSLLAARQAIADAGLDLYSGLRVGFASANTVGGMDKTEDFFESFLKSPQHGRLRSVLHHECGSVTEWVADQLGISDYVTTISTACSSSANSIALGSRLIEQGYLDVVVAGGTDALTRFTLNGFHTLMILDPELCKPFDGERRGLNLGEGAAYLVLVSERVFRQRSMKNYGRVSGYCNANDAYHQTASSPEGTGSALAMRGALEKSGLLADQIDYINLHGTGTQNNDLAEGTAIRDLFAGHYPPMSSTKSFTGHTLGACGAIEAVFSLLSIQEGMIFPSLRITKPMPEFPFEAERTLTQKKEIRHVLSNSFGFGGNCTSLVFSKY